MASLDDASSRENWGRFYGFQLSEPVEIVESGHVASCLVHNCCLLDGIRHRYQIVGHLTLQRLKTGHLAEKWWSKTAQQRDPRLTCGRGRDWLLVAVVAGGREAVWRRDSGGSSGSGGREVV